MMTITVIIIIIIIIIFITVAVYRNKWLVLVNALTNLLAD